jgi:hypothetical protein
LTLMGRGRGKLEGRRKQPLNDIPTPAKVIRVDDVDRRHAPIRSVENELSAKQRKRCARPLRKRHLVFDLSFLIRFSAVPSHFSIIFTLAIVSPFHPIIPFCNPPSEVTAIILFFLYGR